MYSKNQAINVIRAPSGYYDDSGSDDYKNKSKNEKFMPVGRGKFARVMRGFISAF
jgi:hypothetical protein